MEPGAKSREFDASLLASEFLTLRPAKNMSKQPFSKKMSELRMLLRIARVQSTKQSVGSINKRIHLEPVALDEPACGRHIPLRGTCQLASRFA